MCCLGRSRCELGDTKRHVLGVCGYRHTSRKTWRAHLARVPSRHTDSVCYQRNPTHTLQIKRRSCVIYMRRNPYAHHAVARARTPVRAAAARGKLARVRSERNTRRGFLSSVCDWQVPGRQWRDVLRRMRCRPAHEHDGVSVMQAMSGGQVRRRQRCRVHTMRGRQVPRRVIAAAVHGMLCRAVQRSWRSCMHELLSRLQEHGRSKRMH